MKTVFHIIAVSMLCLPLSACLNGNLNWASSVVPNTNNSAQATATPTPSPTPDDHSSDEEEAPGEETGGEEPGETFQGVGEPFGASNFARHGYQYDSSGTLVNASDYGKTIVVHPDGRLIIGVNEADFEGRLNSSSCGVMALNADGSKDLAFGYNANGLVKFTTGTIGFVACSISAMALQGNSILVTGWGENLVGERGIFLGRVDSHGAADLAFGPGRYGYTWTTSPGISIEGKAVKTDSASRIWVVASAKNSGEAESIFIARYDANGTPDATFGSSGVMRISLLGWTKVNVTSFVIDTSVINSPVLYIAGSAEKDSVPQAIVYAFDGGTQLAKSGFLFNSSINGLAAYPALREATTIALQGNNFVFAGRESSMVQTNLLRGFATTGSTDITFGMMGVVTVATENLAPVLPVALTVLADSTLVLLSANGAGGKTILDHFTPSGGEDSVHGARQVLGTFETPAGFAVGHDFYYVTGRDADSPPDLFVRRISF